MDMIKTYDHIVASVGEHALHPSVVAGVKRRTQKWKKGQKDQRSQTNIIFSLSSSLVSRPKEFNPRNDLQFQVILNKTGEKIPNSINPEPFK
jgi:hypothetical protein